MNLKKIFLFWSLIVLISTVTAQTITLQASRFDAGPYSTDGSIAVPFTTTGCFGLSNAFTLWISNNDFVTETQIGSYTSFYATFVNGTIPGALGTGSNFKVRIKSNSPSITSLPSAAFTVNAPLAGNIDTTKIVPLQVQRNLSTQQAFGWCNAQAAGTNLALIDQSPAGSTLSATYYNEISAPNTPINVSPTGGGYTIPMQQAHYTFIAKSVRGGNVGTKAYFLINSPNNIAIATIGEQLGCLPDSLSFKLVVDPSSGGLGNNFPGSTVTVNWGETPPTSNTYRLCDLVATNGEIFHFYTSNSCLQGNGTFNVQAQLNNPFYIANDPNLGTCPRPTVSSTAKIFNKPRASFTPGTMVNGTRRGCLNVPTNFVNTSIPGSSAGSTTNCTALAFYYWFIDGSAIPVYSSSVKEAANNYSHTFTTPGNHTVRLLIDNGSCATHDTTMNICIESPVTASFTYPGGATTFSGCAPSVTPVNTTPSSSCGVSNYLWTVLDAFGNTAPGGSFSISNPTAATPTITINAAGNFQIRLCATNSCNITSCATLPITSFGTANVNFPSRIQRYCNNGATINFQTNTLHTPTYQSAFGSSEAYTWTVTPRTGGTFSFVGGTTSTDRFPQIQFNGYDSFLVKVVYQNNCNPRADSQYIVFNEPVTAFVGNDVSVCFSDNNILLSNAASTGPIGTINWTRLPSSNGTFNNASNLNPTYTFGATERTAGFVNLRLQITPIAPTACPSVSDTIRITIHPRNFKSNDSLRICSGATLNYTPTSSVLGSTFTYTSSVLYGTVTGNTANGSGNITDNLVCTTPTNDSAVVQYNIIPFANGCPGEAYTFKVTIYPVATINTNPLAQAICSFNPTNIGLTSNVPYALYSWTATPSNASVTGFSNQTNQSVTAIQQVLNNTSLVNQTVTYAITAIGKNGCNSGVQNVVVTVAPGPSVAVAGRDTLLCNASTYNLTGNLPISGTPTWSQIGTTPNIATGLPANTSTVNLSGLTNGTYSFEYQINSTVGGCPSTKDTINVTIRPSLTVANAGIDTTICEYDELANRTINLKANLDATRSFENGQWSIVSQPASSIAAFNSISNPNATFTFNKVGTYVIRWTINNDANCTPSFSDRTIRVFPLTTRGLISATSFEVCRNNNVSINLINFTGSILKWQVNPKPFSDNIFIDSLVNTSSITFNNVQDSFQVRVIVQSLGAAFGCSVTDTATVRTINVAPLAVAGNLGADTTICSTTNTGNIFVNGNIGTVTKWIWSTTGSAGPYTAGSFFGGSPFSFTNIAQTRWYKAIVVSGACPEDTTASKQITIATNTDVANAGRDTILCNQSNYTLIGNTPSGGTTTWSQIAGNGVTGLPINTPTASIGGIIADGNFMRFRYVVANGICPATDDTVSVRSLPSIVSQINNATTTICSGQSTTILGIAPTGGLGSGYTYQWDSSFNNSTWLPITGETNFDLTFSPTTSVYVRRRVFSANCELPSNSVLVTVLAPIANNSISPNQGVCIGTIPATIIGTTPTGGGGVYNYQWQVFNGVSFVNIPTANSKDYTPPSLTDTQYYRRIVTTTLCTGLQSSVSNIDTINVYEDARALFTSKFTIACPPFNLDTVITNIHYAPGNGIYRWDTSGVFLSNGQNFPSLIKNTGPDSVQIKLKVFSPYGCKADSMSMKILVQPRPQPNIALASTTVCAPGPVTFTNATPFANLFTYKWEFRNGGVNQTFFGANPPTQNFVAGNFRDSIYKITLTAYSACDSVKKDTFLTVRTAPKAVFVPDRTFGCSPATINYSNLSFGNNITYQWYFDSIPPNANIPNVITTIKNNQSFTYITGFRDTIYARLRVSNECGADSQRHVILVDPNSIALNVVVPGGQNFGCSPLTVNFQNNSIGGNNYFWNYNDGTPPVTRTTTQGVEVVPYTFNNPGSYSVSIRASNSCNDTTITRLIRVFGTPKPSFSASATTVCIGDTISFTNNTDTATTYVWKFGDNTTSVLTNPKKRYTTAGNYTVWLIATRLHGAPGGACIDSISLPITITATQPASVTTSGNVSSCKPFTVQFTNNTVPNNGATWVWGDGSLPNGIGNIVSHTYQDTGTYNAQLSVVGLGGCTYVNTQTIRVNGPSGTWVYDNGFVCNTTPVRFQVTGVSYDSLKYNFGNNDSLTTTNSTIFYNYNQGGSFIPSVTLIAGGGSCTFKLQGVDTIKINKVKAGFRFSDSKTCGSTSISFTDTSRSDFGIINRTWDFGDGSPTSSLQNPTKIYTSTGNYTIKLFITSRGGCIDSAVLPIFVKVNDVPVITGISRVDTACSNQIVQYRGFVTAIDSIPPTNYVWNFGNGASANGIQATNTFSVGIYVDTFTVTTINGCRARLTKRLVINPTPIVTISPAGSQVLCRGNSINLTANGANSYSWSPINNLSCTLCPNPQASPLVSTQYVATGTTTLGCSSTDTINITVPQPFTIATLPDDSICIGQHTFLGVSGANNYLWSPATDLSSITSPNPRAEPKVTTRYQIIGFDAFNCFTDTAFVNIGVGQYPIVNIGRDTIYSTGTQIPLAPSVLNGPIRTWLWRPATDLSCNNCATPIATIKDNICYNVTATNIFGCAGSDTICVRAFCENSQVFIPNAFSPDGDGINDVLMVRGTGVRSVKSFRVFNRWGQVVFDRANFAPNDRNFGWDGKIKGSIAPVEVYVYTCDVICDNGTPFTYKGNVALIR